MAAWIAWASAEAGGWVGAGRAPSLRDIDLRPTGLAGTGAASAAGGGDTGALAGVATAESTGGAASSAGTACLAGGACSVGAARAAVTRIC